MPRKKDKIWALPEKKGRTSRSDSSSSDIEIKRAEAERLFKLCMHQQDKKTCAICGDGVASSDAQSLVGTYPLKPHGKTCNRCGKQALVPMKKLGPILDAIDSSDTEIKPKLHRKHQRHGPVAVNYTANPYKARNDKQQREAGVKMIKGAYFPKNPALLERNRKSDSSGSPVSSKTTNSWSMQTWGPTNESSESRVIFKRNDPQVKRRALKAQSQSSSKSSSLSTSGKSTSTVIERWKLPQYKKEKGRALKQFAREGMAGDSRNDDDTPSNEQSKEIKMETRLRKHVKRVKEHKPKEPDLPKPLAGLRRTDFRYNGRRSTSNFHPKIAQRGVDADRHCHDTTAQTINIGRGDSCSIFSIILMTVVLAGASLYIYYLFTFDSKPSQSCSKYGFSVEDLVSFWMVASTGIHLLTVLSTML